MKRSLVSLSLPLILAACASQAPGVAVSVPENLRPTEAEVPLMTVFARGAQIYECRSKKDDPKSMEWVFVAPEANLFDVSGGQKIGQHYAGPHWQSVDGSKVQGKAKATAAAPRPGAIPWLLLTTTSVGPNGAFAKVSSIQRINTVSGAAPAAADCTAELKVKQARVAYTADYVMFRLR
jgi:hypothetical protein